MQVLTSTQLERLRSSTSESISRSARWAWQGIVDVGHNSLAVLGLACIGLVLFFSGDSALRMQVERQALEWLHLRHGVETPPPDPSVALLAELAEPGAVGRATARDPSALPREQALVVNWLSRRYRVAPEPVASLVQEAWAVGKKANIDPTLILAIMAIESSFNPFAQSSVGAQGLMQVMTSVHDEKYDAFGGKLAAFDPLANLRVGAQILREYVARAGGDVSLALKYYVGAANLPDDGGYGDRVLAEQGFLRAVAAGQKIASTVSNRRSVPQTTQVAAASASPKPAQTKAATEAPDLSPALHTVEGTVMAPAVGAAVAVDVSAQPKAAPSGATAVAAAEKAASAAKAVATPRTPDAPGAVGARPGPVAAPKTPAPAGTAGLAAVSKPSTPPAAASAPPRSAPVEPKTRIETVAAEGRVALVDDPVR